MNRYIAAYLAVSRRPSALTAFELLMARGSLDTAEVDDEAEADFSAR